MKEELKDDENRVLEEVEKRMFDIISESFNEMSATTNLSCTESESKFSVEALEDAINKLKDTIILCNPQDEAIAREVVDKSGYSHRIEIRISNLLQKGNLYVIKKEDMEYKNRLYMETKRCSPLEIKRGIQQLEKRLKMNILEIK